MKITSPFVRSLSDDNFYDLQGTYVNAVVVNTVAWGILPAAVTELVNLRAVYEPLHIKVQDINTRTRIDVAVHRDKRIIYEKKLRDFHNEWITNTSGIPDEQKLILGGRPRDIEPSPSQPITDVPIVGLKGLGGGDIEVRAKVRRDQTRPSMHPDANVIDYRFRTVESGDVPPDDPEDCPKGNCKTRAKFVLRAGAKNAGKRFYGFFRWLNKRRPRQEGPWSNAISVVIG